MRLRVFFDLDTLAAGCITLRSFFSAAQALIYDAVIGLVEGIITQSQIDDLPSLIVHIARTEERRQAGLRIFQELIAPFFTLVHDPTDEEEATVRGQVTDPDDAPILATALRERCRFLITFNVRHYQVRQGIEVATPNALMRRLRQHLTRL